MPFDPIEEARRLGMKQFSHVGEKGFPHLQMSYTNSAFKMGNYTDSYIRLRRHTLLYWKAGFWKTSSVHTFIKELTPCEDVTRQPKFSAVDPSYLECLRFTPARLRGSMSDNGKVVFPLIQRPHIIFAGEFLNLFGTGESFEESMNLYNQVLEEGRATVSLVKMVGHEIDDSVLALLQERGIHFNTTEGIMTYETKGTLMAGCRPLEGAQAKKFLISGMFDRLNVVHWTPSDEEFENVWRFDPPKMDHNDWGQLKEWNQRLWHIDWDKVSPPPSKLVSKVKKTLGDLYNYYESKHGVNKSEGLRSARDGTNIRHLLTAHAVTDTLNADSTSMHFEDLDYSGECFDKTIEWLPEYIASRSPL